MRLIDADELKTAFPCGEYVRTESVRATIDHAPTVPQWIPCSERLPEEEGYFYVTDEAAGMAETLIDKYLRCDDGEWVWLYSQHVVAWMPLPEPWKEEKDD